MEDEVEAGSEQHRPDGDKQIIAATDQPQVLLAAFGFVGADDSSAFQLIEPVALLGADDAGGNGLVEC